MTGSTIYQHSPISLSTLTVSLDKVRNNLTLIREKLKGRARVMAIVKASAYGTDMVMMAAALKDMGIDIFGVAGIDEAINLRKSGIIEDIFVLHVPLFHLPHIVDWNLRLALSDKNSLTLLERLAAAKEKLVPVHLHVNTGMNRFGCTPEEALTLAKRIHKSRWLKLEGIMSHFHSADIAANDALSMAQVTVFDKVIKEIESCGIPLHWRHISNSSAVCRFDLPQYNMVRVGILLFGAHLSESCEEALPLELALTLRSKIIDIKHCRRGETIGYEASYTVEKPQETIGVIGIGYHDGLHRSYGNKGVCCIHGQLTPYVGNICMDFSFVNLSNIPGVSIGDDATIFGHDPSGYILKPRTLSALGNTCAHELIACLGPRIQRLFLDQNEQASLEFETHS